MKSLATAVYMFLLLCALLFAAHSVAFAQGVTTAAINGRVFSTAGEALPAVNIVAVHEPSGTLYGTSTRDDGRYTLPNLRVGGPYTVTATLVGYQKQTQGGINLQLSQNLDLNFTLTEEAVQAGEVVVVGERTSVFNASRTGAASNVVREEIDRLPTLSRNFQDYYKLSPFVTGSGNALGRNSRYNNIQIDGTNFNDIFGLGATGAPAGQSTVTPISLDAIEEFQLVMSPYDVRQAGFTGAGVNVITRSGTNTPKGSLFWYGRNQDAVGKSPDALKKKLDEFTDWQFGFRVGGPVVENKMFYFANGEFTTFSQPLTRTFGNQNLGTNAFTVPMDSLNLLTSVLKSKYNYDPGSWDNINIIRESQKLFVRFDYNLSESHKLTARWNYLQSVEDNSPSRGRSPTDIYADYGRYKLDNLTHSFALQLTSVFGNQASNEFILGYVYQFDNPVYYGAPFPTLYINTKNANAAYTGTQKLVLGAEEFRHYNELGQKSFEITDNFSWYLPGHTVTIGAKVDLLSIRNLFLPDNFGAYTYNSISEFINDLPAASYSYRYSATADPLQEANWKARQFGFYVQDEWAASPGVKITAGIRADLPTYPDKPSYNPGIETTFGLRTDQLPKATIVVSPRLGFNWAVDEERNTQVRGGIGIFSGRFPYVWVSNQYSNTGVDFISVTTVPSHFNPDPYNQGGVGTITSAEVDLTDRNFKAPSVLRWNLGVDHKLPYDLVVSAEGVFSVTLKDVFYKNINLKGQQTNNGLTAGGVLAGENREVWGTWSASSRRYSTQWINNAFSPGVFLVTNDSKGHNYNATIQVQRNVPVGLNGLVGYTWGEAKDINSMNSTTASSGWRFNPTQGNPNDPKLTYSQWDTRHRIVASVSYRYDWGVDGLATTLGVFYNGQSGRPFSYMVVGDVNGDGRSDNDLAYIPKDANDIILMNTAGTAVLAKTDPAYADLMAFIANDSYLNSHKGQISERSGPREPWSHIISLRLTQEIPVIAGHRFEISLDMLNVLNFLNSEWGWQKNTGVNQTVNLMTFHSIETTAGPDYGKPRYQWGGTFDPFQPDNITSRWQAQLGIRYSF
jgi:hypothetical protein